MPRHNDDPLQITIPLQILFAFLPGGERRLTPQGVSVNAIDYYSPWLGVFVPERDRLGKTEMRYDPRDLSHIYLRHPRTNAFQVVCRRDGRTAPVTLSGANQRLRRAIMDENGGGAGRFVGTFATGDRARLT